MATWKPKWEPPKHCEYAIFQVHNVEGTWSVPFELLDEKFQALYHLPDLALRTCSLPRELLDEKSGIVLKLIPAGQFIMGTDFPMGGGDTGALEKIRSISAIKAVSTVPRIGFDESPSHDVLILEPFYLAKTVVTQSQWRVVMESDDCPGGEDGPTHPLHSVTFDRASAFCKKAGCRLPTEVEWEYSCRGEFDHSVNPDERPPTGEDKFYGYGSSSQQYGALDEIAWWSGNSARHGDKPVLAAVGLKKPNSFGLHDMLGNVWEWCSDWYSVRYYFECVERARGSIIYDNNIYNWGPDRIQALKGREHSGPKLGSSHVVRGGAYDTDSGFCRASFRGDLTDPIPTVGFRLAQSIRLAPMRLP